MTPKEKAEKLFFRFYDEADVNLDHVKKCALICVNEMMNANPGKPCTYTDTIGYWQEVKLEINKL